MAVIAMIGMPIVICYTIFVYRLFKGKTRADDHY
jgi:cytochrome d ubiquinol oxidase subunit II